MKKSLRGLICVDKVNGQYRAIDQVSKELEAQGCLETVFEDGKLVKETSLAEIRENINSTL
jgi:nicotinamide phosphoribosyltransferase